MEYLEKKMVKCEICGEYKGEIKEKDLNWEDTFFKEEAEKSDKYLTASCLCEGVLCLKCRKNKIHRPISNSYDPESNRIEHWPSFSGMVPCDECKKTVRKEN